MRRLLAATLATAVVAMSLGGMARAADAADPTVHQIYEAAEAGHFDQAQQMMDQVLKDHPNSAKAHYVQAELFARQGKTSQGRAELQQAEAIDPGLTHESQRSVQELKGALGLGAQNRSARMVAGPAAQSPASHFPWGVALIFVLAIGALWMLFRRRSSYSQYPAGGAVVGGAPGTYGGPAGYGAPGYGGPVGGGMGSGIAGGLASGLAVGAGVVAGEELAHHFLDGGRREGTVPPPDDSNDWQQASNTDMGGTDFGVNDPGSWDDSGGGGGGGGDDWS